MWYAIEGYDGQGVLAQRQAVRPAHVARLVVLRDEGRRAADEFLKAHRPDLGKKSSLNLDVLLEQV